MKKFLLGFVTGVLLLLIVFDTFGIYSDSVMHRYMPNGWNSEQYKEYKEKHPIVSKIDSWMIQPSIGLNDPLTKRCTKDPRPYDGKMQTRREYFGCNRLQILLSDVVFGEYNP